MMNCYNVAIHETFAFLEPGVLLNGEILAFPNFPIHAPLPPSLLHVLHNWKSITPLPPLHPPPPPSSFHCRRLRVLWRDVIRGGSQEELACFHGTTADSRVQIWGEK